MSLHSQHNMSRVQAIKLTYDLMTLTLYIALLKYTLHKVKFTYFKYTIQGFFSVFTELCKLYHNLT